MKIRSLLKDLLVQCLAIITWCCESQEKAESRQYPRHPNCVQLSLAFLASSLSHHKNISANPGVELSAAHSGATHCPTATTLTACRSQVSWSEVSCRLRGELSLPLVLMAGTDQWEASVRCQPIGGRAGRHLWGHGQMVAAGLSVLAHSTAGHSLPAVGDPCDLLAVISLFPLLLLLLTGLVFPATSGGSPEVIPPDLHCW